MTLNLEAVGQSTERRTVQWTSDETLLYALGIGAGQNDPLGELEYTTENTRGVAQRAFPTFAAILTQFRGGPRPNIGEFDPTSLVHAEQLVSLARELPVAGEITVQATLKGIYDKGSGALVVTETTGWVGDEETPSITTRGSIFIRGEGGFGRTEPPRSWVEPAGEPDLVIESPTRPDQALLYRLSGDRNPLHSDPAFAALAGFDRPILHGMCTYGVIARGLLNTLSPSHPESFRSISGRFSRPVHPGTTVRVLAWLDGPRTQFRAVDATGAVVFDRGEFELG